VTGSALGETSRTYADEGLSRAEQGCGDALGMRLHPLGYLPRRTTSPAPTVGRALPPLSLASTAPTSAETRVMTPRAPARKVV